MKPSLEDIASETNPSQDKGIFHVPEIIRKRRVIRYFLEHSKREKEYPIVIQEEKYTRQSAMYKLGNKRCMSSNRNLVQALLEYKLLRTPSGKDPNHQGTPIDNLSLAQIISFAYQIPIEQILVPKSYFSSAKFKSKVPKIRIKTLINAYTGTSWFERFRKKYNRRRKNQKFTPWHNISTADLPKLLCTSDYEPGDPAGNLTKLVSAGLIIPRNKFKKFSSRNFVDVYALIHLASQITGKSEKNITNQDPYINYIARNFIRERLMPHIKRTRLNLNEEVTLEKVRYRTGLDSEVLCRVLKIKPNKSKRFYSRITKMKAIDLALYELKNTHMQVFEKKEIARLFGMQNIDFERCNLFPNSNGTYARHQKVFPFYDSVGEVVKKMLFKAPFELETPRPVRVNGNTFYITKKTIKSYSSAYDLKEFDSNSMQHLVKCLKSGTRTNGKITSPELIFNLSDEQISSVEINTSDYKGPVAEQAIF